MNAYELSPLGIIEAISHKKRALQGLLSGIDGVFLVAGLGGLIGSCATPVIACIVKDMSLPVWAIVTEPFPFEGGRRARQARQAIAQLEKCADVVACLPGVLQLHNLAKGIPIAEAFIQLDEAASDVTSLLLSNMRDVRAAVQRRSEGNFLRVNICQTGYIGKPYRAAKLIITPQFLEISDIAKAKLIVVIVAGPEDMTSKQFEAAVSVIKKYAGPDSKFTALRHKSSLVNEVVRVCVMVSSFEKRMLRPTIPAVSESNNLYCSFCGRHHSEVKRFVSGPKVCICDECISQCSEIIEND
ncbi:MAG: ClpX C4-type zinc finger protein [Mariprofundaceae bacterium]